MELFGFQIKKKEEPLEAPSVKTFAPQVKDDGALVVAAGGSYGHVIDLEGAARTDAELITKYRDISLHPEIERALDDIVNEVIVYDPEEKIVTLDLEDLKLSSTIKKLIEQEFDNVLALLDFQNTAYDIFRRWYVDGRLYYHIVVDEKKMEEGIKELRYIDPRKIRKIRHEKGKRQKTAQQQAKGEAGTVPEEFYLYSEKGYAKAAPTNTSSSMTGVKIAKDSIIYITSGLMDPNNKVVLSHLHKAIKPLNQLVTMEDASVIYRLSRAPERRIFYIDVGDLPKAKAEQYLRDMMTKHKNKLAYDAATGEVRDDRKFMTMMEDFWLPRRNNGRGTEITTLPGGQNLGQIEDIVYFQKRLYRALQVPITRLEPDAGFQLGRASEISRDEVKFARMINRLRLRFQALLKEALAKQLVLKRVISQDEVDLLFRDIRFDFRKDNLFTELKEMELLQSRLALVEQMDPLVGKYFSYKQIRSKVLKQSEEEQEEIAQNNVEEPPIVPEPDMMQPGDDAGGGQPPPNAK